MPPAPPRGLSATGGDPDGDGDNDDADGSSSHSAELLEEQEPDGWIARLITRDVACGCHFHDALDTLLRRAFDRHTWSIEYHCVVYQHRRGLYPDQWDATCLVHRSDNDLRGAEAFLEALFYHREGYCRGSHARCSMTCTFAVLLVVQRGS
jgi:hypothetical protein